LKSLTSLNTTNTVDSQTTSRGSMGAGVIVGRAEVQVHGQRATVEEMKQVTRSLSFDKSMLKHLNEVGYMTLERC
jgi:hypothetical protein